MARFCGYCGHELDQDSKFCSGCGKSVDDVSGSQGDTDSHSNTQLQISASQSKNKKLGIAAGGIVLAICIAAGAGFMLSAHKDATVSVVSSSAQSSEQPVEQQSTQPEKKVEKDPLTQVQEIIAQHGIQESVVATSFGHSDKGSLSILGSSKGYRMVLIDQKNQQMAFVNLTSKVYNFINQRGEKNLPPVIFEMAILNDAHDKDQKDGVWNGNDHMIPVYALYEFDVNGNIIPGSLSTGEGARPSHYQQYLYEQKNVDISNLFLTEMKALHESAEKHNLRI